MQTHPATIADDSARSLQAYIRDAQRRAIPPKDQRDLWLAYKSCRDPAQKLKLRNRLYEANLMLVVFFVSKWNKGRPRLMDLIQEGNLGLLRAIEKFEPERKLSFGTYAVNWIRAFTSLASKRMSSPVHVPAAKLRCDELPQSISIASKTEDDTGVSFLETMTTDVTQEHEYLYKEEQTEAQQRIQAIANRILSDREKYVLEHYILPDRDDADTLKTISQRYGVSREAIRQWALKVQAKIERALTHEPATLAHVKSRVSSTPVSPRSEPVAPKTEQRTTRNHSPVEQYVKSRKVQKRRKGKRVPRLASTSRGRKGRKGKTGRALKALDRRRSQGRRNRVTKNRTRNRSVKSKVTNPRRVYTAKKAARRRR